MHKNGETRPTLKAIERVLHCLHKVAFLCKLMITMLIYVQDQYIFVHTCVYQAIYCGNTEIQVHNLRIATQKLAIIDKEQRASGYSLEFKVTLMRTYSYHFCSICQILIIIQLEKLLLCEQRTNLCDKINQLQSV